VRSVRFAGRNLAYSGISDRLVVDDLPMIFRYRLDFAVLERHDIGEPGDGPRNPTLNRIRAVLAEDSRWKGSMLAPFRRSGSGEQHLIVWVDTYELNEAVVSEAVSKLVDELLPGVALLQIVRTSG
jgi:hypothetical protein